MEQAIKKEKQTLIAPGRDIVASYAQELRRNLWSLTPKPRGVDVFFRSGTPPAPPTGTDPACRRHPGRDGLDSSLTRWAAVQ